MKGIKKTLAAGVFACATLQAHAEVSPWGFGVRAGGSMGSFWGNGDELTIGNNKVTKPFLQTLMITGGPYGEYAFSDYMGIEVAAHYLELGGVIKGNQEEKAEDNSTPKGKEDESPFIRIDRHGLSVPISFCIYPMGREEGEGILRVTPGVTTYFPFFKKTLKQRPAGKDEKEEELKDINDKLNSWDLGLHLGVAYEFAFGLSIEAKWTHFLLNTFAKDDDKNSEIFTPDLVKKLNAVKNYSATLTVGYNIASLFNE